MALGIRLGTNVIVLPFRRSSYGKTGAQPLGSIVLPAPSSLLKVTRESGIEQGLLRLLRRGILQNGIRRLLVRSTHRFAQRPLEGERAPVDPRCLQLPELAVEPHRKLGEEIESLANEIENLLIPKPGARSHVDLQRRRLEDEADPAILHRGDIPVERPPLVGDDGHAADRRKRVGNLLAPERRNEQGPSDGPLRRRSRSTSSSDRSADRRRAPDCRIWSLNLSRCRLCYPRPAILAEFITGSMPVTFPRSTSHTTPVENKRGARVQRPRKTVALLLQ